MSNESMRELMSLLAANLPSRVYDQCVNLMKDMRGGAEDVQDPSTYNAFNHSQAQDTRPKYAMDSRLPGRIVADREVAIAECESTVPRALLIACDSAESVFRTALRHMGNPQPREYPASGLAVLFRETRRAQLGGSARGAAHDSAAYSSFAQKYPDAAKIRVLG